jgi:lysophospholipase L1-like esterase
MLTIQPISGLPRAAVTDYLRTRREASAEPEIRGWFNADNSITQLKPHVILAMVGTVDVRRGNISQGPKDLRNMLTDIFTQSPNSWVILSTIPPLGSQVQFSDQVTGYNKAIMNVAAEFPRVSTIDFYTACNNIITACFGGDGIHPMPAGYDVLTPLWFQDITPALRNVIVNPPAGSGVKAAG